jgi:hypothetical protein
MPSSGEVADEQGARRSGYATPTGDPCPRAVRVDGTVEGSGDCGSCGCCLLLLWSAWPGAQETRRR